MAVTRPYRGQSADARREQRRELLVDAALDCLFADGLAGVSVRAVCARSKLTPRYFYESFTDLDELLVTVVDGVVDDVAARSMAAVQAAPDDTAAQVRAAIETGYGIVADDPRKANVVLVAGAGYGPLRARRQKLVSDYADLVQDGLTVLHRLDDTGGAEQRHVARATALFLMGGSADVIEAVLSGRLAMSREQVVEHLVTMWLGALGAR